MTKVFFLLYHRWNFSRWKINIKISTNIWWGGEGGGGGDDNIKFLSCFNSVYLSNIGRYFLSTQARHTPVCPHKKKSSLSPLSIFRKLSPRGGGSPLFWARAGSNDIQYTKNKSVKRIREKSRHFFHYFIRGQRGVLGRGHSFGDKWPTYFP